MHGVLSTASIVPHALASYRWFKACRTLTFTVANPLPPVHPSTRPSPHRIHRRKHIFITTLSKNNGLIWNGSGTFYVVVMHSGPPARINEVDDTDAARHVEFVCLCVHLSTVYGKGV